VLDNPTKGFNTISLRDLVTHIRTTYASISQPDIDNNMTKFYTGIEASLPLAVYTRKQEKCQMFAQDAGVPISEDTMVTTGTKAALNCGGMELVWSEWKHHPLVDQTWNNWKLHWTAAFSETRDIHQMTANNGAFANQVAAKAEQATMMARLLDNLANAALQKNDTVEKLVTANEKLVKALANANAAIARLCLLKPATAPNGSSNDHPSHWSPVIPNWDPAGTVCCMDSKSNVATPVPPVPIAKQDTMPPPPDQIPKVAAIPTKDGHQLDGLLQRIGGT
jgi:hypothetical protein